MKNVRKFVCTLTCAGLIASSQMAFAQSNGTDAEIVEIHFSQGAKYVGTVAVENSPITGEGTLYGPTGEIEYVGSILNGQFHGFGSYHWPSDQKALYGDRYVGEFVDGKRTGVGTLYYLDGGRHEGQFLNDRPHGEGSLYGANGVLVYTGEFAQGAFHGEGTYHAPTGSEYPSYTGVWQTGAYHGEGTLTWPNGDSFTGTFQSIRAVSGTFTHASGETIASYQNADFSWAHE